MYKTILVHVDGTAHAAQRIALAARFARHNDAHLVGTALTGLPLPVFPVGGFAPGMPSVTFPVDELRAAADHALDAFEALARREGLDRFGRVRLDDEEGPGLCLQARYADLVVMGQRAPGHGASGVRPDYLEYVLLHCARPVLVIPPGVAPDWTARRVTVAWNGSPEAVRAISSAIPLLRSADKVQLLVIAASEQGSVHGQEPGADMARYLARHGITVDVTAVDTDAGVGDVLLSFARDNQCDLLVMGAYGHARLRELVLGGATRSALHRAPLPLWMAH